MGLFLKNGKLINVISGEIYDSGLRIEHGLISGYEMQKGDRIIDIKGRYIAPGFIEGHIHLESTHILPKFSYRYFLKNGVTTVINDPHEIANAGGIEGIKAIIKSASLLPIDYLFMIPSCVPATEYETSGNIISINDMKYLMKSDKVIGLAEMMNYLGAINGDRDIIRKIDLFKNGVIDGHCPGLRGRELDQYISRGIYSDHEAYSVSEAEEKIRKGMYVMIRRGSAADNLELIKIINKRNDRRFMLVSDDVSIVDMLNNNYLSETLRKAKLKNRSIDAVSLIRGVSVNPASYFRLNDRGIITPGKRADITVLDDIKSFNVSMVIQEGRIVLKGDKIRPCKKYSMIRKVNNTHIRRFKKDAFFVKSNGSFPVIHINSGSLITDRIDMNIDKYMAEADIKRDLLLIASIERYSGESAYECGLLKGFGLREGAIASSYNHDAHNILVIGTNSSDMADAVNEIAGYGGGIAYVKGKKHMIIPFDIYGVMSSYTPKHLYSGFKAMESALKENGVKMKNPLTQISFLSLSVIPYMRITDKGLYYIVPDAKKPVRL